MTVRLAGFQLLSQDLPPTLRDTVDAEIGAAFSADGVVGVSNAAAASPGAAPAYALGGSIQRDGQQICVITRMVNERSGATLWTNTLVVAGNPREAKRYFDAAIDLAPSAGFAAYLTSSRAVQLADLDALQDPKLGLPPELRTAVLQGHRALAARDSAAKAQAVQALLALPENQQWDVVARLLADLGATHDALRIATRIAVTREYPGPSIFWSPSMRATLSDPGFPAVATQLGLMEYWKTTGTRPDVCDEENSPPFCRML